VIVVGVGASRGCPDIELEALVEASLDVAAVSAADVDVLASVDVKADEPAVLALAAHHGWTLRFFAPIALAAITVPTPSAVVATHIGTPSVAEASALLAAGDGGALMVFKQRSRHATCAIARRGGVA
jgi:cobalt-precorrin 5A hydrolase/cobalt-precorrin 5A hydrolase/precorrin-3B C17-methyltransferase